MLGIFNRESRTRRRLPLLVGEEGGAGVLQSAWRFALVRIHPRTR